MITESFYYQWCYGPCPAYSGLRSIVASKLPKASAHISDLKFAAFSFIGGKGLALDGAIVIDGEEWEEQRGGSICMTVSCKLQYLRFRMRIGKYIIYSRNRSGKRSGIYVSILGLVCLSFLIGN